MKKYEEKEGKKERKKDRKTERRNESQMKKNKQTNKQTNIHTKTGNGQVQIKREKITCFNLCGYFRLCLVQLFE